VALPIKPAAQNSPGPSSHNSSAGAHPLPGRQANARYDDFVGWQCWAMTDYHRRMMDLAASSIPIAPSSFPVVPNLF